MRSEDLDDEIENGDPEKCTLTKEDFVKCRSRKRLEVVLIKIEIKSVVKEVLIVLYTLVPIKGKDK